MNDCGSPASADNGCSAPQDGCPQVATPSAELPALVARQDAATPSDKLPFVAQNGRTLYLVAEETRGWVVAELEFDVHTCAFTLQRQSEYRWPREALGRLLTRVLATGQEDNQEATRMSEAFSDWLANQFVA